MFRDYGELATVLYELTKPAGFSVIGDIEYYTEKLKCLTSPILEAGVGTGRMLVPLIQSGLSVDGTDISDEMLARCRLNMEKAGISGDLYRQDLRSLDLPKKYGAIIIPTGSFCLIPHESAKDVLKSFYDHLEPGGRVLVDIIFPTDFVKGETKIKSYPLTSSEGILYSSTNLEIDWFKQKATRIIKYELLRDGLLEKTEVSNFTLYWFGIQEFWMMLESVGFTEVSYEFNYGAGGEPELVTFIAMR